MKRRKMKPIPPELKERFERNQRVLAARIALHEQRAAERKRADPPQA